MKSRLSINQDGPFFIVDGDLEIFRVTSALIKEPETIAWINSWQIKPDDLFLDIGANIGIYTLYAAHKHKNLSIGAIEPENKNYISLMKNINENAFKNLFGLNIACGAESKITKLYVRDTREGNSGAQINLPIDEYGNTFNPVRVETILSITLDDLVFKYGLGVPTYLKIDVDGLENDILNGMRRILSRKNIKSMLVEFNCNLSANLWIKKLRKYGLCVDLDFENLENHSTLRRQKNGSNARNVIFISK